MSQETKAPEVVQAGVNPVPAIPTQGEVKEAHQVTAGVKTTPEPPVKVVAPQPPVKPAAGNGKDHDAKIAKAHGHLKDLENHALTFAGKSGMNPFAYINGVLRPCRIKLVKGASEKELDEMLALTKEDPTVAKHWKNPLEVAI